MASAPSSKDKDWEFFNALQDLEQFFKQFPKQYPKIWESIKDLRRDDIFGLSKDDWKSACKDDLVGSVIYNKIHPAESAGGGQGAGAKGQNKYSRKPQLVLDLDGTLLVQSRDKFLGTFGLISSLSSNGKYFQSSFESRPIPFTFENRTQYVVFRPFTTVFIQTFSILCSVSILSRACVVVVRAYSRFLEEQVGTRFSRIQGRPVVHQGEFLKSLESMDPWIVDDNPSSWVERFRERIVNIKPFILTDPADNLAVFNQEARDLAKTYKDIVWTKNQNQPKLAAGYWHTDRHLVAVALQLCSNFGFYFGGTLRGLPHDVIDHVLSFCGGDDCERLMLLLCGKVPDTLVQQWKECWLRSLRPRPLITRACIVCRLTAFVQPECACCHGVVQECLSDSSEDEEKTLSALSKERRKADRRLQKLAVVASKKKPTIIQMIIGRFKKH